MSARASGTFDVKLTPRAPDDHADSAPVGRLSLDKQFHGDLEAVSVGQMLAIRTDIKDSAGYVAMERVSGKLHGRSGSFALQHSGSMDRGAKRLSVSVVPDSGSGELLGINGTMSIDITEGKHFYGFEYTLPGA